MPPESPGEAGAGLAPTQPEKACPALGAPRSAEASGTSGRCVPREQLLRTQSTTRPDDAANAFAQTRPSTSRPRLPPGEKLPTLHCAAGPHTVLRKRGSPCSLARCLAS